MYKFMVTTVPIVLSPSFDVDKRSGAVHVFELNILNLNLNDILDK